MSGAEKEKTARLKILTHSIQAIIIAAIGYLYVATPDKIVDITNSPKEIAKDSTRNTEITKQILTKEISKMVFVKGLHAELNLDAEKTKELKSIITNVLDSGSTYNRKRTEAYDRSLKNEKRLNAMAGILQLRDDGWYFVALDGVYRVREGKPTELQQANQLANSIYYYRNKEDVVIPLYYLRRPIFKAN